MMENVHFGCCLVYPFNFDRGSNSFIELTVLVKKAQCHIYQNMRKFINLFLRRHNCSSHLSEVKLGVLSAARSAMQGTTPHTQHKSLTLMIILPTLIITLYYNIFFLIYLSFSRRITRTHTWTKREITRADPPTLLSRKYQSHSFSARSGGSMV